MPPTLRVILLLLVVGVAGACRSRGPATGGLGAAPMTLEVEKGGPWEEVSVRQTPKGSRTETSEPAPGPVPEPRQEVARRRVVPVAPALPVPTRRTREEPAARQPLASRARQRFLDNPTLIRAGGITFYCPREQLPDVRLTGDRVTDPRPGRRIARGRARLTCRELTLESDRITLVVRDDGISDVQITATRGADFVSTQGGSVIREEGVRSLVITNDRMVPLR